MAALLLVCDTSGSMLETGARFVVRGVVYQVAQFFRLGYAPQMEIQLVAWSDEVKDLAWHVGDKVPAELLQSRGVADGESLVRFLDRRTPERCLVVSDGFWTPNCEAAVMRWKNQQDLNHLRFVKAGAGANPGLKGPEVFQAEDLFAALDGLLSR